MESQKQSQDEEKLPSTEKEGKDEEIGGRKGPEPTRYGDWEKGGRCVDF
jgi:hypothetical protein